MCSSFRFLRFWSVFSVVISVGMLWLLIGLV